VAAHRATSTVRRVFALRQIHHQGRLKADHLRPCQVSCTEGNDQGDAFRTRYDGVSLGLLVMSGKDRDDQAWGKHLREAPGVKMCM